MSGKKHTEKLTLSFETVIEIEMVGVNRPIDGKKMKIYRSQLTSQEMAQ